MNFFGGLGPLGTLGGLVAAPDGLWRPNQNEISTNRTTTAVGGAEIATAQIITLPPPPPVPYTPPDEIIPKFLAAPNVIVYYLFQENIPEVKKDVFRRGAEMIRNAVPALDFVEITQPLPNKQFYVLICYEPIEWNCCSYIGQVKPGQDLWFCSRASPGNCAHELLHLLGFEHEHSRHDRDKYLNVTGDDRNVKIATNGVTFGEYDFDSIMHYHLHKTATFSISLKEESRKVEVGQRLRLSQGDIEGLNHFYPLLNSANRPVRVGSTGLFYCGGAYGIEGSDGYCGPNNGPQCADCRSLPVMNHKRRRVRVGSSGLFYCGGPMTEGFTGSNGICGPNNGPQCADCLQLPSMNCSERLAYLGSTGLFYCGGRMSEGVHGSDGTCGPNNGPQCDDCQLLVVGDPYRHLVIIQNISEINGIYNVVKGSSNDQLKFKHISQDLWIEYRASGTPSWQVKPGVGLGTDTAYAHCPSDALPLSDASTSNWKLSQDNKWIDVPNAIVCDLSSFIVAGCPDRTLNGIYDPSFEFHNGACRYYKRGNPSICVEYEIYPNEKRWAILKSQDKGELYKEIAYSNSNTVFPPWRRSVVWYFIHRASEMIFLPVPKSLRVIGPQYLDGLYDPTDEVCNGWIRYKNRTRDAWMEYHGGTWQIKPSCNKSQSTAWIMSESLGLKSPNHARCWKVYRDSEWHEDKSLKVEID